MSKSKVTADISELRAAYQQLKQHVEAAIGGSNKRRRDPRDKDKLLVDIEDAVDEAKKMVEEAGKQIEITGKKLEETEKILVETSKRLEEKIEGVEYWKRVAEVRLMTLEAWESRILSLENWRNSQSHTLLSTVSVSEKASPEKDSLAGISLADFELSNDPIANNKVNDRPTYATAYVCDERTDPPTMVIAFETEAGSIEGCSQGIVFTGDQNTGTEGSDRGADSEYSERITRQIHERDSVEHVKHRRTQDWVQEAAPIEPHDDTSMDVSITDEGMITRARKTGVKKKRHASQTKSPTKIIKNDVEDSQRRCMVCRKNTRKFCGECSKPICTVHCSTQVWCPDYNEAVDDCFGRKDGKHVSKDNISKKSHGRCIACPTNSRITARTRCKNCKRFICKHHQQKFTFCNEHVASIRTTQLRARESSPPILRRMTQNSQSTSIRASPRLKSSCSEFPLDTDFSYGIL